MASVTADNLPKIVLLCGYAGHGKDTFLKRGLSTEGYDIYAREEGRIFPNFRWQKLSRIAFADRVKSEVAAILGVSVRELERLKNQPIPARVFGKFSFTSLTADDVPKTYRSCMVEVACNKRKKDPYHWVRLALLHDEEGEGGSTIRVVTDFRFPQELDFVTSYMGTPPLIIRIHRPNVGVPPLGQHTEHVLDELEPDFVVTSVGAELTDLVQDLPYMKRYTRTF